MNAAKSQFPTVAAAALLLLWAAFVAYVWGTAAQCPEKVATHFGASGAPNGWMTRAGHVQFTILFGTGVPVFVLGIFAFMGRGEGRGLNIPHKDYWLSPERRQETFAFIHKQGFFFAALFILFLAGVHRSILLANLRTPVALPAAEPFWLGGGFVILMLVWVAVFVGHFYRQRA